MKPLFFSFLLAFSLQMLAQEPFAKMNAKQEAFEYLSLDEIKPTGWLKKQIQTDLNGFVGHLDNIVPDLIVKDDIYGKDRLSKYENTKDLGKFIEGEEWEIELHWWNSETQSNWWDGYIRNAFFAEDKEHIKRIEAYVNRILATQDNDGYLGIYGQDLRYKFNEENGENGELWSKASLYRGLLAYYSFTKDKKVLKAVERAVQNVMDNYTINVSQPFFAKKSFSGLCHGLAFTDVLDRLYQLTHDSKYWDYALFLYKDYSSHNLVEKDIQFANIMNPEYRLKGHGAHTYEHLRTLLVACYASGNPQLKEALKIYLHRIEDVTTSTGGAIGDEWIEERKADPTYTGYEYCSLLELLDSYGRLIEKTGEISYAGRIENIFFNAAMGSRHPEKSAIAYLKTDNSYEMTGECSRIHNPRYKYSPAHQDVAVCCVPNAGRITPYYIQYMWLRDKEGFIASLLGSCEVNTQFNNQPVTIREITDYPYSNRITLEVETKKPVVFTLKIRKPEWDKGFTLDTGYEEDGEYIIIRKKWSGKEVLNLDFKVEIEKNTINDEVYFTYGRLVLALPIEAIEIPKKVYTDDFQDFEYAHKNLIIYKYLDEIPVKEQDHFHINLYNPVKQKPDYKELIPIGKTILRQVTFIPNTVSDRR
jgi:DUF1680 family protein